MTTVYGEPQGKARPRFSTRNGYVQTYTASKTKSYENQIAEAYKGKIYDGYISIDIKAYFGIPKSATKKNRLAMLQNEIKPSKKPDADNIAKIVLDALNGIAYIDDKQVICLKVEKEYSETPRIEFEIKELK